MNETMDLVDNDKGVVVVGDGNRKALPIGHRARIGLANVPFIAGLLCGVVRKTP
jgi:ABC-type lipopolysaccharide export system ATPase subunit